MRLAPHAGRWLLTLVMTLGAVPAGAVDSAAAQQTALNAPDCRAIQPFYWEIGDGSGVLAGGGAPLDERTVMRDTAMLIASASKWWYGAYVVERRQGALTDADLRALRMLSGYHDLRYGRCLRLLATRRESETVAECLGEAGNDTYTAADVDRFFYNGGHFQQHAVHEMGLGDANNAELARRMNETLGGGLRLQYDSPQLAAGGISSVAEYSQFLRRLLNGQLRLGALLGAHAVCTQPGAACPGAVSTPVTSGEAWHYALAHWVEDDPRTGDGAFSSPGAFGFYPWIDAHRRFYGVVARHSLQPKAYLQSVNCGRQIRRAYLGDTPATTPP